MRGFIYILFLVVGLVISYFIVGMIPVLWMASGFILLVLANRLANSRLSAIQGITIPQYLVFIGVPIFFFFHFGWLTALLSLVIPLVALLAFASIPEAPDRTSEQK